MYELYDALSHLHRHSHPHEAMTQALKAGVQGVVVPAYSPKGWAIQSHLAHQYTQVRPAYGIHPWVACQLSPSQLHQSLDRLAHVTTEELFTPCAIGEIGLDKHPKRSHNFSAQHTAFCAQLDLARDHGLPVILHIVAAHGQAIEQLSKRAPIQGLVHGFSGSQQVAQAYQDLGLCIGFGHLLCDPRAKRAKAALISTDTTRILIESDSPDRLAGPHQLNQVLTTAADLLGWSPQHLAETICCTWKSMFEQEGVCGKDR